MKKPLTFILLTLSSFLYGQLQDFDAGIFPPTSPNAVTIPEWSGGTWSGDPATWYRSDDLVVNGTMGNNGLDVGFGGSGNCAILYSNMFDGYQCCGFEVDMMFDNIDMSSYTVPQMKFYIKHPDGDEEIEIAASNMGGAYDLLKTINSNFIDWTIVTVDLSAYAGSNDVSIRFRGVEGPDFNSDETNVGIDEILIEEQTSMVYVSSTTSHVGCGLKQGYNDQSIMRIDVVTQGSLNPFVLTEFLMNTNGSTDDANDVVQKKIYSTGSSNVFNTSNLIGYSNSTGNYSVSGAVILNDGINYFWVACDIPSTSTLSNVVDAECTGLVIEGNTETPLITAPAGNVVINNTGVFAVTNLNDTGAGSLRQAVINAYAYGCGEAFVDATGVSGTINWGTRQNGGPTHDVTIIGAGSDQLIIDGGGADGFLYHYGDGGFNITGLQIKNCAGEEIVYKPNSAGDLSFENCWFDNNSYRTVYFVNSSGSFSASNCTFSNNSSAQGTMYLPNIEGSVNFSNCTFYNNSSSSTAGVFYAANVQGGLFLENCTLLNNSCPSGTGGIQSLGGTCTAINTTFENTPNDFTGQINMNYSHMSNTAGATISGANNLLNVTANLGTLANYGGATPTCSVNAGSPLIDAGTVNLQYDQRGFSRTGLPDIGAFEFGGTDLPVELANFNTHCTENGIKVNWQTASEHNSDYFEVEKSSDYSNWSIVQTATAAGNSTTIVDYSIIDFERLANEVVYYRLNQYDKDGVRKVYGPITAKCKGSSDFSTKVYPNPTNGEFTIEIMNVLPQNVSIQLMSADGKEMVNSSTLVEAGSTLLPMSMMNLDNGKYLLRIVTNKEVFIEQIVIAK